MQKNMGVVDRGIRTIVGLVLAVLIVTGELTGTAAVILGIVAAVLVLTSAAGFCPLYLPFKVSTKRKTE